MRDLLNIIQTLTEAAVGLSAGEITKYDWRFQKFIDKIKKREPFTLVSGEEVIIDPREAKRFEEMEAEGNFKGTLKARSTTGEEIPLSKLAKTGEFGGAAVAAGQEASTGGKEGLLVKPSQIGICDKDIPSYELYDTIINNPVLQSTEYGRVVIQLAEYIVAGEYVMIPEEYRKADKKNILKAIVDYAGEYLGVLALLYRRSRFPRRKQFEDWLGDSTDSLTINFPGKANNNLADSFAIITNGDTDHSVNISSKGTGGGAAPAISGLKVPDYIRDNPKLKNAIDFIDICQTKSTTVQGFDAMDLIYKTNPDSIDKKWHPYLPFAEKCPDLVTKAKENLDAKKKKLDIPLPKKYQKIASFTSGGGTDGGKVIYGIKKEVAEAINKRNAIPEFKDAILQLLEMNFIQQYADYKAGELLFATQWPAKLDGDISVENKSSTTEPTAGGFSFKLGRTDDSVSSEVGEPEVDNVADEYGDDVEVAASDLTGGPSFTSDKNRDTSKVGDVGRMKRK